MAIPRSVYPGPFIITRASHVILTVKDLGATRAFYAASEQIEEKKWRKQCRG